METGRTACGKYGFLPRVVNRLSGSIRRPYCRERVDRVLMMARGLEQGRYGASSTRRRCEFWRHFNLRISLARVPVIRQPPAFGLTIGIGRRIPGAFDTSRTSIPGGCLIQHFRAFQTATRIEMKEFVHHGPPARAQRSRGVAALPRSSVRDADSIPNDRLKL